MLTNIYTPAGGAPELGALSITLLPLEVASGTNRAQWRVQGHWARTGLTAARFSTACPAVSTWLNSK